MSATFQKIQASKITQLGPNSLLQKGDLYRIPIYQRDYFWDGELARRFFQRLIHHFRFNRELSFLGTMLRLPAGATMRMLAHAKVQAFNKGLQDLSKLGWTKVMGTAGDHDGKIVWVCNSFLRAKQ